MKQLKYENRFWSKVDKKTDKECWNWLASCGYRNYGKFRLGNTYVGAHRMAYALSNGYKNYYDLPKDMNVCHSCDNPACCNPNHLFLGTFSDNMNDMINKKRTGGGNQHNILSTEKIKEIRDLYAKYLIVAKVARLLNLEPHRVGRVIGHKGVYENV
jgi:hypothetical protein